MPSADSIPQHVDSTHVHTSSVQAHTGAQPISRQTLQALSAVPRSRFISNDMWMQAKKKPENQRSGGRESTYNYQHWLIQVCQSVSLHTRTLLILILRIYLHYGISLLKHWDMPYTLHSNVF
jgi:hypothetical protein